MGRPPAAHPDAGLERPALAPLSWKSAAPAASTRTSSQGSWRASMPTATARKEAEPADEVNGTDHGRDVRLLMPGLLRQPGGLQCLGAVEVVVGFDDQAVSQAVHDGEGLRVGRVAGCTPTIRVQAT